MLLGIDIGGTAVKMAILDERGVIHARHEAGVSGDGYQTPVLQTVMEETARFLAAQETPVRGIGVSATGQIDERTGVVIGTNGKIPHYEGTRIKEEIEARFSLPVWALNDANAAVLGECFAGRARGFRHVLMITLGTGVGGGMVLDGKLYGGLRGIAGEMGHFTLYQDGVQCTCGKRGCFESYASTTALLRLAREATGEAKWDGRAVFERAAAGEPAMQAVLNRWIDDIAAGITGLVHIFNPEMVLIGGGVSAQEALLMQPLRARVLGGVMPRFAQGLCVERAVLGNDAGVVGAVKFWMDRQQEEMGAFMRRR